MYPTGTVTFLFTDLEESSRLWELHPEAMMTAMARHDAILREGVEVNQGLIVKTTGDGLHAVFDLPADALQATLAIQQAIQGREWLATGPLRVRMGLHTGQTQWREGDYYGPAVNRAARVMSVAAGGQVLLSMATAELVRDQLPDGLSLAGLGRHRLRSLDRPERLYQLQHSDLPADFPPLKSIRTTPNNLPIQLDSFIGREIETAQVRQLLTADVQEDNLANYSSRLITLTGPGGTGKSRLSFQVAGEILDTYPDGIWLVELATLTDPEQVVRAVAEPFNIPEQPGRPLLFMLVDYLRSRKILIILDNCEHLIDACAQLADELLRGCLRLRILASSREALGIAGERAFRVRSLSLPASDGPLSEEEAAGFDAIRLFVTRAEVVKNDFTLSRENAVIIAHICRRLDGIPLAIELAAARARVLTPQQILDRLDDRFRLLTGGSRTALPRQRTLQALIDWSYDLLSEEECVLLRRLSIFSGGWTLEAAESVTGVDPLEPFEILDFLEQLHNKSLITVKEGDLGMRYHMLETIRQYAQAKLFESGEADQLRDRHLHFFVEHTQKGGEAMLALKTGDWVERLTNEIDNHRAARAWALENDINAALKLMVSITTRLSMSFAPAEAMDYLETVIEIAESQPRYAGPEAGRQDRRLLGAALASAANLSLVLGIDKAAGYAIRAEVIAREQNDLPSLAAILLTLGGAAAFRDGDTAAALEYLQEVDELLLELNPGWIKAMVLVSFVSMFLSPDADGIEKGWQNWQTGMAMFRDNGEFWGLAFGHQSAAGIVSIIFKDLAIAQTHAERALEIFEELGDAYAVNIPRSRLADIARQRGELDQATPLYKEVVSGWRNVGQFGAMARCLECLAFIGRVRSQESEDNIRNLWLSRSVTLISSAETIRKEHDSPMNVLERSEYNEELAKIKQATGERAFQEAWKTGQVMDPDQAILYMQEF